MSGCLCLFVLSKLWKNGLEVANITLCVSNFRPSSQARVTSEKSSSPFRLTRLVFKFSWKSFHRRKSISDIISMENHLAQYQTRKTKSRKVQSGCFILQAALDVVVSLSLFAIYGDQHLSCFVSSPSLVGPHTANGQGLWAGNCIHLNVECSLNCII